ncbi:MAG: response regulator [Bacteroidia bacterium]
MTKLYSVLLIESGELDNFIIQKVLENSNISDTTSYNDSASAIEHLLITDKKYDLILVHLHLKALNGIEFARKLKELNLDKNQGLVCVLSASVNPQDEEVVIQNDCKFILKPLTVEKIESLLQNL